MIAPNGGGDFGKGALTISHSRGSECRATAGMGPSYTKLLQRESSALTHYLPILIAARYLGVSATVWPAHSRKPQAPPQMEIELTSRAPLCRRTGLSNRQYSSGRCGTFESHGLPPQDDRPCRRLLNAGLPPKQYIGGQNAFCDCRISLC